MYVAKAKNTQRFNFPTYEATIVSDQSTSTIQQHLRLVVFHSAKPRTMTISSAQMGLLILLVVHAAVALNIRSPYINVATSLDQISRQASYAEIDFYDDDMVQGKGKKGGKKTKDAMHSKKGKKGGKSSKKGQGKKSGNGGSIVAPVPAYNPPIFAPVQIPSLRPNEKPANDPTLTPTRTAEPSITLQPTSSPTTTGKPTITCPPTIAREPTILHGQILTQPQHVVTLHVQQHILRNLSLIPIQFQAATIMRHIIRHAHLRVKIVIREPQVRTALREVLTFHIIH